MRPDEYQEAVGRTKSAAYHVPAYDHQSDVVHAAIGIATEAGEFLDPVKKFIFYGKPFDLTNMDEEIGDLLWYIGIYLNARGKTFEQVMQQNIDKLRTRYPEKFTEAHALHRDLDANVLCI